LHKSCSSHSNFKLAAVTSQASSSHALLLCSYEKLTQLTSKKAVVVLPAFETAPNKDEALAHALAGAAAGMNKSQLKRLVDRNLVYQFAKYLYDRVSNLRLSVN
jgi:hypothetical protein